MELSSLEKLAPSVTQELWRFGLGSLGLIFKIIFKINVTTQEISSVGIQK